MKYLVAGFSCFLLSLSLAVMPTLPARALATELPPENAPVVISEIYADSTLSPEKGSGPDYEFVELHNRSETAVEFDGFTLKRDDQEPMLLGEADYAPLQPGEYRIINPEFSLPNTPSSSTVGVAISLAYTVNTGPLTINATYYTAIGQANAGKSLQLKDSAWLVASKTPNLPPDQTTEPPEEEPPDPACSITDVHLSEIAANPSGSDTLGSEFIELYNNGESAISLEGCTLSTDKLVSYEFSESDEIPAKSYKTILLSDKLLNSGGTVRFETATYEEVVQYGSLGDDEAWALINSAWQRTTLATPGGANQASPGMGAVEEEPALAPCPAGKYRNPETGRCKNVEATLTGLAPCDPGEERNPATNRCRSVVVASTSLVACSVGQERNPETNRCRKVATTDEPTPCKEGYERNPETNRCRKISGVLGSSTHTPHSPDNQKPTQDWLILGAAGLAIGGFLAYEYRHALGKGMRRLFNRRPQSEGS